MPLKAHEHAPFIPGLMTLIQGRTPLLPWRDHSTVEAIQMCIIMCSIMSCGRNALTRFVRRALGGDLSGRSLASLGQSLGSSGLCCSTRAVLSNAEKYMSSLWWRAGPLTAWVSPCASPGQPLGTPGQPLGSPLGIPWAAPGQPLRRPHLALGRAPGSPRYGVTLTIISA